MMSTALSVGGSGAASRRGPAVKSSEGLRTARWVKRQLLTRAPKTAEEIALDDKEVGRLVLDVFFIDLHLFRKPPSALEDLACHRVVERRRSLPRKTCISNKMNPQRGRVTNGRIERSACVAIETV